MAKHKYAARRVRRNQAGKLEVYFVDVSTGEIVTDLTGYLLYDTSGFSNAEQYQPEVDRPSTPTPTLTAPARRPAYSDPDPRSSSGMPEHFSRDTRDDPIAAFKESGLKEKGFLGSVFGGLTDTLFGTGDPKVDEQYTVADPDDPGGVLTNIPPRDIGTPSVTATPDSVLGDVPRIPIVNTEFMTYGDIDIRDEPLADNYVDKLKAAVRSVDPSISVYTTSAGQPATGGDRIGTTRHDVDVYGMGNTADIKLVKDGRFLSPINDREIYKEVLKNAAALGFPGIGVYDTIVHIGGGTEAAWGPDKRSASLPPDYAQAINEGRQMAVDGRGQALLANFYQATPQDRPIRYGGPVDLTGTDLPIDPALLEAVNGIRATIGQEPVQDVGGQSVYNPDIYTPGGQVGLPSTYDEIPQAVRERLPEDFEERFTRQQPQAPIRQTPIPEGFDYQVPLGQSTPRIPLDAGVPSTVPPIQQPYTSPVSDATGGFSTEISAAPLNNIKSAFLATINQMEGAPEPNEMFGYNEFSSLADHPRKSIPYGDTFTTAAGLYQITAPTWDEFSAKVGVMDFSKESQDAVAWGIAEENYSTKTGRDLTSDLSSGDPALISNVFNQSANRWASLPGGVQSRSQISDVLASYKSNLLPVAPSPRPIGERPVSTPVGFPDMSAANIAQQISDTADISGDVFGTRGFAEREKVDTSPYKDKIASVGFAPSPKPVSTKTLDSGKVDTGAAKQKLGKPEPFDWGTFAKKPTSTPTVSTKTISDKTTPTKTPAPTKTLDGKVDTTKLKTGGFASIPDKYTLYSTGR